MAVKLTLSQNLPAILLTPLAAELGISEGVAGQTVTATAVVGLITSLLVAATVLLALRGFAAGIVPIGWSTWLTRVVPDEAESRGSLLVAAIQLAITLGAVSGGFVFDKAARQGRWRSVVGW